jgi:hypothetical protein
MAEGYLEPFELRPEVMTAAYPRPDIGGVPLYDPDRHWYGTALAASASSTTRTWSGTSASPSRRRGPT